MNNYKLQLFIGAGRGMGVEFVKSALNAGDKVLAITNTLVTTPQTLQRGFIEELAKTKIEQQLQTGIYGPMNVTRAILPVMRRHSLGHVISISAVYESQWLDNVRHIVQSGQSVSHYFGR